MFFIIRVPCLFVSYFKFTVDKKYYVAFKIIGICILNIRGYSRDFRSLSLQLNLISNSTATSKIHFDYDSPMTSRFFLLLLLPPSSLHVHSPLSTLFPRLTPIYAIDSPPLASDHPVDRAHETRHLPRPPLNPSRLRPKAGKRRPAGLNRQDTIFGILYICI
jgi:hypothetical protein